MADLAKIDFLTHFLANFCLSGADGGTHHPDLLFSRAEAQRTRTPRANASITNRADFQGASYEARSGLLT